jgi:uncharacterized protein
MKSIELNFDRELADFFRISPRVVYPLTRRASIKDIIEAQGVPHTEVGEILADAQPRGFEFIPDPGLKIVVKSVQIPFDILRPDVLRPEPFEEIRFLVDVNVGKLAPFLRMTGYDVLYDQKLKDREMAFMAHDQKRVVLSRDRGLLKHSLITFGRLVRSEEPYEQLREVMTLFSLSCENMFTRCLRCNHLLERIEKEKIVDRLEPKTRKYYNIFSICPGCDSIYWPGSHWEKMCRLVKITGVC